MSSTYVHYSEPSSLPTDYALVSRYQQARQTKSSDDLHAAQQSNEYDADDDDDDSIYDDPSETTSSQYASVGTQPKTRRFTLPTQNNTRPLLSPLPESDYPGSNNPAFPHERTPLLIQVPRIEETPPSYGNTDPTLWTEFVILFRYTIPVLGSHLLEYSLVVASVISIGHISTTALAASTLGSMTAGVTAFSIIQGLTSALDTLLPSAWTSQHPNLVGLWSQRMAVVISGALVPIFVIWFNSESLLLFLKQEPEVAYLASRYLKFLSIGLPAYSFNAISRRYFQSQGLFTVPTRIIMIVCPINILLNYLLVWGPKPIALGFIGAPISTAISFNLISISSIIVAVIKHRKAEKKAWHPFSRRTFTSLGILVQLGIAGVGQTASEWWSWELIGLAASQLGPISLATQSVLLVSASTTYQAPYALSVAVAVRIGNVLGEGDYVRARMANTVSLMIALIFATFASSLFVIFRKSWAHIFNDDPEVVQLVASILPFVALFQVFDGLAGCTGGILRARGKQFLGALLNLSAYYVIGIPFGIWLAFSRSLGLAGLWIGLTLSLVYCATIGVWICAKTDWEREVRKVAGRLQAQAEHAPKVSGNA